METGRLAVSAAADAEREDVLQRLERLNEVGALLSHEAHLPTLLEKILDAAASITRADGGTLYLVEGEGEQRCLHFEIVHTHSIGIRLGGTSAEAAPFYPIPLIKGGEPNTSMVAAFAAIRGQTVNIADAYSERGFDFSGTRNFDSKIGYRSRSFLTVPMKDHQGEVIGVLQLINCTEGASGNIIPFSEADRRLAESLASQAAIALTNRQLVDQLQGLFESFIGLINAAIDEKSPYTGGHCQRVPALTMMLADAVAESKSGPLSDFHMSAESRYELHIAGLLHDCGKITTPVHVVDKRTKLDGIFDRIALIDTRFAVIERDAEIDALKRKLGLHNSDRDPASIAVAQTRIDAELQNFRRNIDADRNFLRVCNNGSESMDEADRERILQIAKTYKWEDANRRISPFLSAEEADDLRIKRGTLNAAEREIVNHHIVSTINMLEALPWPKHLRNVPEFAGGHHERMDGKGYPRGLTRDEMSVQARIMGIADIFEALTAKDRPYKNGKTLSESLRILGKFAREGHIDPDLFQIFVREKVYLKYAEAFLDPAQIDEVDEASILGIHADGMTVKKGK